MCTSCSCSTTNSSTPDAAPGAPATSPTSLTYVVSGMSCAHCEAAVNREVTQVAGVTSVAVDLATKLVRVDGTNVDDAAVRAAIDEAGYDAVPA